MDKVLEKALDMLGAVASKLGSTAEALFPEITRYLVFQQVGVFLAFAFLFLLGAIVGPVALNISLKADKAREEEKTVIYGVVSVLAAVVLVVGLIGTVCNMADTIAAISSPTGYAAMHLLKSLNK